MIQMGERAKYGYGGRQEMRHLTWVLKDEWEFEDGGEKEGHSGQGGKRCEDRRV